jgi:PAS domain S-box-containing protein
MPRKRTDHSLVARPGPLKTVNVPDDPRIPPPEPVDATAASASHDGGSRGTKMALKELLPLLVESVHDYAIFALDPTGHILTWNQGAQRFKGYKPDEIIGSHFSRFYPAADIASGKPDYELEVAAIEGRFEDEGWRVRKDGTQFWANVVITALRDESGTLVGYAKVTRDLTERRQAELRALDDARRIAEVEAANRAKSEFLATMSHELRTPLNAIGGYVDLMMLGIRGPLTEQQTSDLQRVRLSQQHLLAIINDLLNFSRLEAGRVSYALAPLRIADAFEAVQPMIEPQAVARGIQLHCPPVPDDAIALADGARVEQILVNLLGNAVKFTEPGGTVTIACEAEHDHVVVIVSDTGVGIPEDKLDSIFEPFVQLGRTLSSPQEGTGLGLAISRDLARAMRGDLRARSEPGIGSSFRLILPRAKDADAESG